MGEKKRRRKRRRRHSTGKTILLIVGVMLVAAAIVFGAYKLTDKEADDESSEEVSLPQMTLSADAFEELDPVYLGKQLYITKAGSYAGMFVEDGTDEIVTDVMMAVLENQSEQDLQYAEIAIDYESCTAHFTVSNVPAGESVVLLEAERQTYPETEIIDTEITNVVFFEEPMSVLEKEIKVTGADGCLNIENISGQDISSKMYVYYKHKAGEFYFGGITYRVEVPEGLPAGSIIQAATQHFDSDTSVVVAVTKME